MSAQDVQDWIGKQVAGNDVVLFMKGTKAMPQCGFSMQVAQILQHLGVDFKDINVLEDISVREGVKAYSKWPTESRARLSKRVYSPKNFSLHTPVGPLRCLPMITSARPLSGESLL